MIRLCLIVFIVLGVPVTGLAEQGAGQNAPASDFDASLAKRLGADDCGMRVYVMAFLKTGPVHSKTSAESNALMKAHLANIHRMAEEGKLVLAGPFMDKGDLRGIYLFDVPGVEEARALTASDPAIKAGVFVMELHRWYGSAALMQVNAIDARIARKTF